MPARKLTLAALWLMAMSPAGSDCPFKEEGNESTSVGPFLRRKSWFNRAIAAQGVRPAEPAQSAFVRDEAYRRHEIGGMSDADYFESLRTSLGIGISDAAFLEGWNAIFAGEMHQEILFVCAAILAIFFWASLFSLFPITVGHYFGEKAAGSNYGVLYAIAKGSGGLYGGILSTLLISQYRFSVAIGAAAGMAILAGLIVIPLKFNPPIWREAC